MIQPTDNLFYFRDELFADPSDFVKTLAGWNVGQYVTPHLAAAQDKEDRP